MPSSSNSHEGSLKRQREDGFGYEESPKRLRNACRRPNGRIEVIEIPDSEDEEEDAGEMLLPHHTARNGPPDERDAPRQSDPYRYPQALNYPQLPELVPRPLTPEDPIYKSQQLLSPPSSAQRGPEMDPRQKTEFPPNTTLWVGSLPFNCTEDRLYEVFGWLGKVNRISIPHKDSGRAKQGFGYVEYNALHEAQDALREFQGLEIGGRRIRLEYASPTHNHPRSQDSSGRSDFGGPVESGHPGGPGAGIGPGLGVNPQPNLPPATETAANVVPVAEPTLCPEQQALVELILSRRNVFYTGSAGCGKSTVLKAFVKRLREEQHLQVDIVAPTGRAALDINGSTTWTYCGWTPDHHAVPLKDLMADAHQKKTWTRLTKTDVLVIDEISMVENLHLERINHLMKEARGNDKPFGGVQIVATGDFCQLPPVKPLEHCIKCGSKLIPDHAKTTYRCMKHGLYEDKDKWAFCSKAWAECDFEHVNLTTIHRQSDRVFIDILNSLRMRKELPKESIHLLLNHESQTRNAVQLFPTRHEVKKVNDEKFNKIKFPAQYYKCLDDFIWRKNHKQLMHKGDLGPDGTMISLRQHRYEGHVYLKRGMLVVLQTNLDLSRGLINGSQGTIQGFEPYNPGKMPKAARRGEPVVTSGPRTLQGEFAGYRERQISEFAKLMNNRGWPIVQFQNGVRETIYPDCTVNELGDEKPKCLLSRTQVPLMAGWAMTVHKSQGMTLNRVIVDLAKSFEEGQAYVALSRATDLQGLKVVSFPDSAQRALNPQVKAFFKEKLKIE